MAGLFFRDGLVSNASLREVEGRRVDTFWTRGGIDKETMAGAADNNHVGRYIKLARDERGLSLEKLGVRSGLDASTLSKFENGLRPVKPTALIKIAQALGVEPEELRAGMWQRLALFRYPTNPAPYRAGSIVVDRVCRLYGNHTHPLELSLRYAHAAIVLQEDIAAVYDDVLREVAAEAERNGTEYFNGPNCRLLRLLPNTSGADEKAGAILELAPVSWENFMVLNGSLDEDVWPGDKLNTFRKRFADPEDVFRYQSDLRWSKLSNILTLFLTPITSDGFGIVQLRSGRTVLTADRLTSGVTENINRYKDEAPISRPHIRRKRLPRESSDRPDWTYRLHANHAPSPLLCALRGIYEELSEGLYDEVKHNFEVVKFLNLGFNLDRFHPVLIGIIELPFTRAEVQDFIEISPGKDLEWKKLYYLPLDVAHPDTREFVFDETKWDTSGLASFISAVNYWRRVPL